MIAQFVLPENIAHAFLSLLFLLSGQWVAFLLNLPLVLYNVNKCVGRDDEHFCFADLIQDTE